MQKRKIILIFICLVLIAGLMPVALAAETTKEVYQELVFEYKGGAYAGFQFAFATTPGLEFIEYRPPFGLKINEFYDANVSGKTSYGYISESNSISPRADGKVDMGTLVFKYTEGTTANLTISNVRLVRVNSGNTEEIDPQSFNTPVLVYTTEEDKDKYNPSVIIPTGSDPFTAPPLVTIEDEERPLGTLYPPFITGFEDGTIRPDALLTRAQLAQIIYNLYGAGRTGFTASYSDVANAHWAYPAIAFCQEEGYMIGSDGGFRPEDKLSRAELCTAFARIKELEPNASHPFTDVGSHWAGEFIGAMYTAGFVTGDPGGTFRPNANITRAEALAVICRADGRNHNSFLTVKTFTDLTPGAWYYEYMMHAANGSN